jgi:hypothetical protein
VWKANALPENANEPALIGVSVNCFIKEIATFPLPNGAFSGSLCAWSGVWEGVYPCRTTASTGWLAVNVTTPEYIEIREFLATRYHDSSDVI